MKIWIVLVVLLIICVVLLEAKKPRNNRNQNRRNQRNRNKGNRGGNRGRTAEVEYVEPVSGQRIRLGGSENRNQTAGNVEVFVRNKWGIVCDDGWGIEEANVVCKQLGFTRGAIGFTKEAYFGEGTWNKSDILMDDVICDNTEGSVQACNYEMLSNCDPPEAAGVVCHENQDCPDNWVAGPHGCYKLPKSTTTQRQFAVNKCKKLGGHLVNIETEAENHFLSMVFANESGEPIITGAIKKRGGWMWEKITHEDLSDLDISDLFRLRRSPKGRRGPRGGRRNPPNSRHSGRHSQRTGSITRTTLSNIRHFKWFPGWLPGNRNAAPSNKKNDKCIYLRSSFPVPDSGGILREIPGYLYWDDEFCKRTKRKLRKGFRYLCERPKAQIVGPPPTTGVPVEECYRDNGADYEGNRARTDLGTQCLSWSDVGKRIKHKYPTWEHNYCRNPDNETRPWCFVNYALKWGFCPVPRCVDGVVTTTPTPATTTTTAVAECPDNKFYCTRSARCIPSQWSCDIEPDCEHGEDEVGCDYKIVQFRHILKRQLSSSFIKETFTGVSNETCAKYCIKKETYVCRSFAFTKTSRKCDLSETNTQLSGEPEPGEETTVFELLSQTINCSGMFTCTNGRCIEKSLVCDQKDQCGDLSDEVDCGYDEPVQVRLAGGDEHSGRVEVKYLGEWGVICDDNWDANDAAVICRMLGYPSGSAVATGHSKYGEGNGRFMLDEVGCSGIEDNIDKCDHRGWKVHDCRSHEVAGVKCPAQKVCLDNQYTCGNGKCLDAMNVCDGQCNCIPGCEDENGNGTVSCQAASLELVNGTQPASGRVEIIRNGLRGTVCDDNWDNKDATVVCKMMGFRYGEAVVESKFGSGTGPIWLDDVECSGSETSLSDCEMSNWGVSNCDHSEDAGVICSNTVPETTTVVPPPGSVRLVGGSSPREGRVEIVYDGIWGTICDDSWDKQDAKVVCRMLGFSGGVAKVQGHYGPGSQAMPIWLDNVGCRGSELELDTCSNNGLGRHDCAHGEDAGVQCSGAGQGEDNGQSGGGSDDPISPKVPCGRRPRETHSRKKREEERVLAEAPKFERIIGGFTAAKGFYPWQVGVRRFVGPGVYQHWCGGTILNEQWILSAAHCFTDLHKSHIVVRTGDHDNKRPEEYEQQFEVEQLINHNQYDENTYDYDIALLKIKPLEDGSTINFTDYVQPACLPTQNTQYAEGQKCHISGWGKTESGYPNMLKSAKVPLIADSRCQRVYKDLTDNMVCAGYFEGGIDSCAGDSGGPLVCEINDRFTVMGATSWGAGCAEANAPGVYARVTVFLQWIEANIRRYS